MNKTIKSPFEKRPFIWRRTDLVALAVIFVFSCFGHWRLLFLDAQPVGGDKTHFSYGLMAYYGERLQKGELMWWNDRWGFGYPGIAESQIGAFYPPHLVFYYFLDAIDAFRINFLFHRLLTGVSAYLAFRVMGLRVMGAWVAGMIHVGGGFAVGHFDHQWAVEALPWVPWLFASVTRMSKDLSLKQIGFHAFVLAMLLFIGHFQIAFMCLVGCGFCVWRAHSKI